MQYSTAQLWCLAKAMAVGPLLLLGKGHGLTPALNHTSWRTIIDSCTPAHQKSHLPTVGVQVQRSQTQCLQLKQWHGWRLFLIHESIMAISNEALRKIYSPPKITSSHCGSSSAKEPNTVPAIKTMARLTTIPNPWKHYGKFPWSIKENLQQQPYCMMALKLCRRRKQLARQIDKQINTNEGTRCGTTMASTLAGGAPRRKSYTRYEWSSCVCEDPLYCRRADQVGERNVCGANEREFGLGDRDILGWHANTGTYHYGSIVLMSSGSYGATESPPTADRLAKFLDGSCGARDTSQDTHTYFWTPTISLRSRTCRWHWARGRMSERMLSSHMNL